jgi:hypothetical protein
MDRLCGSCGALLSVLDTACASCGKSSREASENETVAVASKEKALAVA